MAEEDFVARFRTENERGFARSFKRAGDAADDAGRRARGGSRGFTMLSTSLRGVGGASLRAGVALRNGVVGGLAVAGVAAGVFGKSAVESASDVNESTTKNIVLFGKYARSVDRFSRTSAKSLGISRREALASTGVFGNLFTALEIGPKKAAKLSIRLTTLAGDLASFNNASPEDALEAIRSGLVGETEPLRRFGVNMSDATLRAEALRQGLVKNTKESLLPQVRALAATSLMFRQTRKAQGDFKRTSEGLANQQRILKARFSDLRTELGTKLLPAAVGVTGFLNRMLDPLSAGIDRVLSQGRKLPALAKGLSAALRGKAPPAPKRAKGSRATGPGTGVGGGGKRGLSGLESFAKRSGEIFRSVKDAAVSAGRSLVDAFAPAMPFLQNVLLPVAVGVGKGIVGSLVIGFRLLVPVLRVAAGAIKVVATVLGWVGKQAKPLRGWIDKLGIALGVVAHGPMLAMGAAARAAAAALAGFVRFAKAIPSKLSGLGKAILSGIASGITGAPGLLIHALRDNLSAALDSLPGPLKSAAKHILPGFARGGRVQRDGPILVGERGPEVLNAKRGDDITPNARLGRAAGALAGGAAFLTVPIVVELDGHQVGRGMGRIALQDLARA